MKKNSPLRVLQVLNHMDYGGIEAVVMNYYRFIDRGRVQFDFAVSEESRLPQKEEIHKLGGEIYLLPGIKNPGRYITALKKIIREHGYKIVHCHMNTLSVFPLAAAYLAGVKVRICHNHTTAHRGEGKRALAKYLLRPFCKWFATDYFACGEYAGKWMYGNKCFETGQVYVMRNAVDVGKFRYNSAIRVYERKKLGLEGKFVVGHIGRFMHQKNHDFLIDVFHVVHQKNKNAVLLLIGEGELEGQIRKKVQRLGLENAVIFYGSSQDISRLYHVMDVFCLPSFYEGLPVVAIEAQVSGLLVISSDVITSEAIVLENYEMISLEKEPEYWAGRILCVCLTEEKRMNRYLDVEEAGFSIKGEAEKIMDYYLEKRAKDTPPDKNF